MTDKDAASLPVEDESLALDAMPTGRTALRVMAVGLSETAGLGLPAADRAAVVVALPFSRLTARAVADARPDLVLAPLLGAGFDALDVGTKLAAMGYRGRFWAVTPQLPDAGTVTREVQAHLPGIDFRLLVRGADAPVSDRPPPPHPR